MAVDIRSMLRKFGVVTVMDVKAYKAVRYTKDEGIYEAGDWDAMKTFYGDDASKTKLIDPLFRLDTLKISNINSEGPTKTATGGQNADTLIKYGKTFTIEMQDALGKYDVLAQIYGVNANADIASITDRFPGELTLVGTTFVIDQPTGAKQPLKVVIPIFLGDGIFNLTQEAEGDVSVFDINGNILRFTNGFFSASEINNTLNPKYGNLYDKGSDNEFYFFATEDGFDKIAKYGYAAASISYTVTEIETTVPGSGLSATSEKYIAILSGTDMGVYELTKSDENYSYVKVVPAPSIVAHLDSTTNKYKYYQLQSTPSEYKELTD